jgi:hypothetical protein
MQQVQSNMLLNDPLLQSDATAASDSLILSSGADTQTQAAVTAAGATDPTANWAQILKQDPSLAGVLVKSQLDEGLITMLGQ